MKEISITYDKFKILKYLGLSIILLTIFILISLNFEYLSHREPSSSGRYKWVGELFYENEFLLLGFSILLNLIFLLVFIDSAIMLFRGKLTLKKNNGIIYKNGKYFVEQKDIRKTEFIDSNNNSSIQIYLNSLSKVPNKRETKLDKLLLKGFWWINKNKIQIRLSFLDNSKENYDQISKFLMS